MWISKEWIGYLKGKLEDAERHNEELFASLSGSAGENRRLLVENQRLVSTLEWFKHRLTQVEQERAQLIYAATGGKDPNPGQVKIAYPNFVGEPAIHDTLNAQNNPFGTVGEDSNDPAEQAPEQYSMPGYGR